MSIESDNWRYPQHLPEVPQCISASRLGTTVLKESAFSDHELKLTPVTVDEPDFVEVEFLDEDILERFPFPLSPFGYGVGCGGPCKRCTTLIATECVTDLD